MRNLLRNLGPLGALLAAGVYLCWPHIFPPSPREQAVSAVTKLNRRLLEPELTPASGRNPLVPITPPADVVSTEDAALAASNAAEANPSADHSAAPVIAFKLRGTFIGGHRKCALLDDCLCFEGEPIPLRQTIQPTTAEGELSAADVPPVRFTLTQVEHDYVVLSLADRQIRLDYSSESASAGIVP